MTGQEIYNRVCWNIFGTSTPDPTVATHLQGENGIIAKIHQKIQQDYDYWFMESDNDASPISIPGDTVRPIILTSGGTAVTLGTSHGLLARDKMFPESYSSIKTGDTTNGSPTVINISPNTNHLVAGLAVSGVGIPAGRTILTVDSSTQITLSGNASADGTGVSLSFSAATGDGMAEYGSELASTTAINKPALASGTYGFNFLRNTFSLPTGFKKEITVRIIDSAGAYSVLEKLPLAMNNYLYKNSRGDYGTYPTYYEIYGDYIQVFPVSSEPSFLYIRYFKYFTPPTDVNFLTFEDTVTTQADELMVCQATYELAVTLNYQTHVELYAMKAAYEAETLRSKSWYRYSNKGVIRARYCDL